MHPVLIHTPEPEYYGDRRYISNSDLSALKNALTMRIMPANIREIYDFGNLFDALTTEPELVDHENMTVWLSDGTQAHFTKEQFDRAKRMKESALANDMVASLVASMQFQVIVREPEFEVITDYAEIIIPAKLKADMMNRKMRMGADLKSCACTSTAAFINMIDHFDYDRQAAWYMDVSGCDSFVFIGVAKQPDRRGKHGVFIHCVRRGDPMYLAGKAKYQRLAVQYKVLIWDLNPTLLLTI